MATVSLSQGGATLAQATVTVNQAVPQFDGRATVTMTPFPTTTGSGSSVVQTPSTPDPYPVWDGYGYMGSDISLASDAHWGTVYQIAPPAGHHSPYWTGATPNVTQAYIAKIRPTGIGNVYYWSESITIMSMDPADWGTFLSLGYETRLNDQLGIGIGGGGVPSSQWSFAQTCGLITNGVGAVQYAAGFMPVVLGQRVDLVAEVKIASDNTGYVILHVRVDGGQWGVKFSKTNVPTTVWTGTDANGNPTGIPTTVLDKAELYFGWWSQTKSPAPTGVVRMRGLQRWGTLADAVASLG